jgi:hypothetical protein
VKHTWRMAALTAAFSVLTVSASLQAAPIDGPGWLLGKWQLEVKPGMVDHSQGMVVASKYLEFTKSELLTRDSPNGTPEREGEQYRSDATTVLTMGAKNPGHLEASYIKTGPNEMECHFMGLPAKVLYVRVK